MKSFLRRPQTQVTIAELLSSAEEKRAQGVPCQVICHHWLLQDHRNRHPKERQAYEAAERQLFGEMLLRNQRGIDEEKRGELDQAIIEYEANVADQFVGAHPYRRLQAIYLTRRDYDNALRISRIHSQILARGRSS